MDWVVYFDIDGTLISSTADEDEVVTTAETFGLTVDDEATKLYDQLVAQFYRRNFSDGYRRATDIWREHYGFDIDPEAFTQELKRQKIEKTQAEDDIETVLSALTEDVQLGILTNGSGDIQRGKLERYGIEHFFDSILISGELDTMKPEDEIFQRAMNALPAEQHVYIADRLAFDIVPARQNGMIGAWITDTPCPVADCTFSSVSYLTLETLRERV